MATTDEPIPSAPTSSTWWERFGSDDHYGRELADDVIARHLSISISQARQVRQLFPRPITIQALDNWAADCDILKSEDCESWTAQDDTPFLGAHRVEIGRERQSSVREFAVIVWDHSPGHIALVFELGEEGEFDSRHPFPLEAAGAVSRVLAPVWWRHARVFVPISGPDREEPRYAQVALSGKSLRSGSLLPWRPRRRLQWEVSTRPAGDHEARTVAKLLGAPVPAWPAAARTWRFVEGWAATTQTVETTASSRGFRDLFSGLRHLSDLEVPEMYPVLFGQISRQIRDELEFAVPSSPRVPEDHWQWAVRMTGAVPRDILELLDRTTASHPGKVPQEEYLPLLEAADRCALDDIDVWAHALNAISRAVENLPWPGHGVHVRALRGDGPLMRRWLSSLIPISTEDPPSHRLNALKQRLWRTERCYRDVHGRYVATGWDAPNREFCVAAEWPGIGLEHPKTDFSAIAADQPGENVPVFIVRNSGGETTVEPLPADAYAQLSYGSGVEMPGYLYRSLVSASGLDPVSLFGTPDGSELVRRLRTATGALRLDGAWVRSCVEADVRSAEAAHAKYLAEMQAKHGQGTR